MDTRKIQQVGGGTFTVSLPKEWAESHDVAPGTVVTLHTHVDGVLVVEVGDAATDGPRSVTITLADGDPERVEQALRAAYAAGYVAVTLAAPEGFTDAQRRAAGRITRRLSGLTMADESDDRLVVRTLLDTEEVSLRQSVRQLAFVALSMHREATAALTGTGPPGHVADRDDQADRLFALVDRYFDRALTRLDEVDALGLDRPALFELWATARELERVADHAEGIAACAAAVDAAGPPGDAHANATADAPDANAAVDSPNANAAVEDFDAAADAARQAVEEAVSVVLGDADARAAHRALARRDRVREVATAADRRLFEAGDADYRFGRAFDAVRRTAEHAGNVAELGLRSALRRGDLPAWGADGRDAEATGEGAGVADDGSGSIRDGAAATGEGSEFESGS